MKMEDGFTIKLNEDARGLFWALLEIYQKTLTGVLEIQGVSTAKSNQKKEIAFLRGETVAIRSNRPQEKLVQYLLNAQKITRPQLEEISASGVDLGKTSSLMAALMQKNLLNSAEIPNLLEAYFRERLFNVLSQRRGVAIFTAMEKLPEGMIEIDDVRLTSDFKKVLWEEVKKQFEEAVCRSRFSQQASSSFELTGEFPLPLNSVELREWNQLKRNKLSLGSLNLLQLQLATVAVEFNQIKWGSSGTENIQTELSEMLKRFKIASPYEILGVDKKASVAECKTKHLEYVKKYHPDRLPKGSSDELSKISEAVLAQVNEAFDTLSDPERREEYDAEQELKAQGGMEVVQKKLKAELRFEEALMALRRKHFQPALQILKEIEDLMKENPEFQCELAYAELMAGGKSLPKEKLLEIQKRLEAIVRKKKDYADAYYYWGLTSKLLGDEDAALSLFDRALAIDPNLNEASSEARVLRMRREKSKTKSGSWFKKA